MEVLETLVGLHILYQITCLSPCLIDRQTWTLRESKPLEIYSLSIIAVSLALMLFSLVAPNDVIQTAKNDLEQTVDFIQMFGIRIAHIISISEGLLRRQEEKKFYEEIKQVDGIFECCLNIDVKNREFLRTTKIFGFLFVLVYLASELFILISNAAFYDRHFLVFWCLHIMPLLVCGLRYFQIFTTLRVLKHRFKLLLDILRRINLENKDLCGTADGRESLNCTYSLAFLEASLFKDRRGCEMESPELKRLLTVRDLYNRLYSLHEIFNCNFGLSLLINLANDFLSITSNSYWIFINFNHDMANSFNLIGGSSIWSLPHLMNIIVVAMLCENVVQEANKIALNLHRINVDVKNDNHNTVIEQFSLQLLHQKISISAAGFFSINCALLYTIVGAITTYLIILIQFHLSFIISEPAQKH